MVRRRAPPAHHRRRASRTRVQGDSIKPSSDRQVPPRIGGGYGRPASAKTYLPAHTGRVPVARSRPTPSPANAESRARRNPGSAANPRNGRCAGASTTSTPGRQCSGRLTSVEKEQCSPRFACSSGARLLKASTRRLLALIAAIATGRGAEEPRESGPGASQRRPKAIAADQRDKSEDNRDEPELDRVQLVLGPLWTGSSPRAHPGSLRRRPGLAE